ncbi:MarR family transcriptional regulator [Actinoplanes sp. M2I2]|uniref:MarR family winged helix-turn-helix transcriptional regulator n=1 Tax=Actinoplanes sp. M2I2 TaxID=1734444 RepID=UPI00201FFD7B|nr:MarR family transcriptional regulator [Actinoplanes sp. M2I2]
MQPAATVTDDDAAIAAGFERFYETLRRLTPRGPLSLTAASTLRRLERSGPHRLCELYAPEGISQPAMTQLVTRLEKEGLAQRTSDPHDGRAVVVSITDAGRAAVADRRRVRAEALAELLQGLTPAQHEAVVGALPALERLSDLAAEQAS